MESLLHDANLCTRSKGAVVRTASVPQGRHQAGQQSRWPARIAVTVNTKSIAYNFRQLLCRWDFQIAGQNF
jgi:hypothetical protein